MMGVGWKELNVEGEEEIGDAGTDSRFRTLVRFVSSRVGEVVVGDLKLKSGS